MDIQKDIMHKLHKLQTEHQTLEAKIRSESVHAVQDQLALCRLKKQKLEIKDKIAKTQSKLLPDIIA